MHSSNDRSIALLAHNVRSLWNVGSFFRTADAFAVEKIFLTGYTGHPPRKEISKTAIGAEEVIAWEGARDPMPFLHRLKEEGYALIALEITPEATDLAAFRPPQKACLIVGHELTGVPQDMLAMCDSVIRIPMMGTKESLNVAVAAGIALHHLRFDDASLG